MRANRELEPFESSREDAVAALYGVLERDNALSQCCAVRALERIAGSDAETAKRLIGLLLDSDPDLRLDSAAMLGRMRAADAAEPLIDRLRHDPDGDVRIQATIALARIGGEVAVEPLIACLQADGYPGLDMLVDDMEFRASFEVQSQALLGLGELGDERAAKPVIALLEDEDYEDLQETGFRVLARLDVEPARDYLLDRLKHGGRLARRRAAQALGDLAQSGGNGGGLPADIVAGLSDAVGDADPSVRACAAETLAASRDPGVVTLLTGLLADPDEDVRRRVATVLASTGGGNVASRLHPLLEATDPRRVRGIVDVLGEIADPASREPLSRLLDSPHEDLRYGAVQALGKLALAGPEDAVADILGDGGEPSALRSQAAWALGRILAGGEAVEPAGGGRPDHRAILTDAAFDADDGVALAALTALAEIDPGAAEAMLAAVLRGDLAPPGKAAEPPDATTETNVPDVIVEDSDPENSTLASILAGQARPEPPIEEPLIDEPPVDEPRVDAPPPKLFGQAAKVLAARLLGNLADAGPQAIAALIDATVSPDLELRREAILSLGRSGDENALSALLNGLVADQRDLRLAALEAVGGFSGTTYVQQCVAALLDDPDPFVRQRAIETLGRVAPGKLPAERLLRDPDRDTCRAVLGTLAAGRGAGQNDGALSRAIVGLMFEFSGELRHDAARALRRIGAAAAAPALLAILGDAGREDVHWICIDALAEMLAPDPARNDCARNDYQGARRAGVVG